MKKGDRVQFQGQTGTITEARHVTPGMIDLKLDTEDFVRRAPRTAVAKLNGARRNPLSKPTLKNLRARAKALGLSGYSRMKKAALVAAITEAERRAVGRAVPGYREEQHTYHEPSAGVEYPYGVEPPEEPASAPGSFLGVGKRLEDFHAANSDWVKILRPRKSKDPAPNDPVDPITAKIKELAEVRKGLGKTSNVKEEVERIQIELSLPSAPNMMRAYLRSLSVEAADPSGLSDRALVLKYLTNKLAVERDFLLKARSLATAERYFPKPSARVLGSVKESLRGPGAGVFTRPDPPRIGGDGTTFCGNVIDGTAYYVAVSNTSKGATAFLTWPQVILEALLAGKKLEGTEEVIPYDEGEFSLGASFPRTTLLRKFVEPYLIQIESQATRPYLRIIEEMIDAGVQLQLPNGRVEVIAGLLVQRAGTDTWELTHRPAGDPAKVRFSSGDVVRIVAPRPEMLEQVISFYDKKLKPRLEASGAKVAETKMKMRSVSRVRGKLQRGKEGKAVRGVDPEQVIGGRASQGGYEAIPGLNFAYPSEQSLIYPKVVTRFGTAVEKFKDFLPYGQTGSKGWHTWKNDTGKELTARQALLHLSKSQRPRITAPVADMLFESAMVSISEKGGQRSAWVANVDDILEPGAFLHVWSREKAASPYYSWVPALTTSGPSEGRPYQKCVTDEEDAIGRRLSVLSRRVRQVDNAFKAYGRLFHKLRLTTDGTAVNLDPSALLARLGKALAQLDEALRQVEFEATASTTFDRNVAEEVQQILATSPLQLDKPDSPLRKALEKAELYGLVTVTERADGRMAARSGVKTLGGQADFYELYLDYLLKQQWLGKKGLLFLDGRMYGKRQHPLDDLYQWTGTSRSGGQIVDARDTANMDALYFREPPRRGEKEERAAWWFGRAMRVVALKSKSLRGSQRDQIDALSLLVTDVYRTRRHSGMDLEGKVDDELLKLYLLTVLYYDLGGYRLHGPLTEIEPRGYTLQAGAVSLEQATSEVIGGKPMGSSPEEPYTVYKTYNPVLFEMTRLYWPGRAGSKTAADPRWQGLLTQKSILRNLDAVGRYGVAAALMQQLVIKTRSEAQISNYLTNQVVMEIYGFFEETGDELKFLDALMLGNRGPQMPIKLFTLLWPIQMSMQQAFQSVRAWAANPTEVLARMKTAASKAAPRLLATREAGLPPAGDLLMNLPEVQAVLRGQKRWLDPRDLDPEVHEHLANVLRSALTGRLSTFSIHRPAEEDAALKEFQRKPGQVLRRDPRSGKLEPVNLKPMRPPKKKDKRDKQPAVYHKATLQALIAHELSPQLPPGEREFAGQTSTPWLMRKETEKGATRMGKDLYSESMLAQVQKRKVGLTGWISRIDEMLAAL